MDKVKLPKVQIGHRYLLFKVMIAVKQKKENHWRTVLEGVIVYLNFSKAITCMKSRMKANNLLFNKINSAIKVWICHTTTVRFLDPLIKIQVMRILL